MIHVEETELDGVRLITPEAFEDHRGSFIELFDREKYREVCGDMEFVQDDISVSHKNVLRGLHGDYATTKLLMALSGTAYVLLADNRKDSPTYRKWQAFTLSGENRHQLLAPAGVAASLVALEDDLVYYYKQNTHFAFGQQFTIKWDDPSWGFEWPIENPILSERDAQGCYAPQT